MRNHDKLKRVIERRDTLMNTRRFYHQRKYKQGDHDPIGEEKRKRFLTLIDKDLKEYDHEIDELKQEAPDNLRTRRNNDLENLVDDIMLLISWLIDNTNVSKSLTAGQIKTTAEMIVEDYGILTTEDIALVFRRAVSGQMGDIYRLDPQVIMKWIRDYKSEVVELGIERNCRKHLSIKGSVHDERSSYNKHKEEDFQTFKAEYIRNVINKTNNNGNATND